MRIKAGFYCRTALLAAATTAGFMCATSIAAQSKSASTSEPLVRLSSRVSSIDAPGGRLTRRETEFNPKTGVTSVFFDREGSAPEVGETSLILNFYGWDPASSAEEVAQRFAHRYGSDVIFKFQAPDPETKMSAYFLFFEDIRAEKGYGYADITKVSMADGGAYAITFSRRILGKNREDIDRSIKAWLLTPEGKAATTAVGNMTADATWRDALNKRP